MQQPKKFNYKIVITVPYAIKFCSIKFEDKNVRKKRIEKKVETVVERNRPIFYTKFYKGAGFEQDSKVVNKILFLTIKDFKLL